MNNYVIWSAALWVALAGCRPGTPGVIYQSDAFSVYRDRVVEGRYVARALSPVALTSNYLSPASARKSPEVTFKFSINGGDNAAPSGEDCRIVCAGSDSAYYETPVIKFGSRYQDTAAVSPDVYLRRNTRLRIRVDMREVLRSFREKGFYRCFNGEKIYRADFNGVFVAGGVAPLTWDFNNLRQHKDLQLADADGDGIYEVTLTINTDPDEGKTASSWQLTGDLSAFPRYQSPDVLSDALYNLAVSEMQAAIEPDSTFRTGKAWAGVWTRDISYSILLSMAVLQPRVAIISLKRKVKNGRIIQDTGTGGAYPVSTDRIVWVLAAWEVYKVTGDTSWLRYAYGVGSASAADDARNVYDKQTGLVKGESSFLDWREQTYPRWMQPADIYESQCLGTNAVHYRANVVLGEMASILGHREAAGEYRLTAARMKAAINRYLWQQDSGYYAQYRYGRLYKMTSPRAEALGEALAVLFGVAGEARGKKVVSRTPVTAYGIPCIYPEIPGIPPYHNNAVWPFVESFWALASARADNERSVVRAMSAVYRPAALFLTNKENFVAADGDYGGTAINSANMLWSLSGSISLVYKLLFGMRFSADSLSFAPFVPRVFRGKRSLRNFRYRDATLNITLEGWGNRIRSFRVDGQQMAHPAVAGSLQGTHAVSIVLEGAEIPAAEVHAVPLRFSPATPSVRYDAGRLCWSGADTGVVSYRLVWNGKPWKETPDSSVILGPAFSGELQVIALARDGTPSFASEPVRVYPSGAVQSVQPERFNPASHRGQGFTGAGFVETDVSVNPEVTFRIDVPRDGIYRMDVRYANGSGPVNTDNKCAMRTLLEHGIPAGTFVFPQRGKDEWSNWGWSNALRLPLRKGSHVFAISYRPFNRNMDGDSNRALLDEVRIVRLSNLPAGEGR